MSKKTNSVNHPMQFKRASVKVDIVFEARLLAIYAVAMECSRSDSQRIMK